MIFERTFLGERSRTNRTHKLLDIVVDLHMLVQCELPCVRLAANFAPEPLDPRMLQHVAFQCRPVVEVHPAQIAGIPPFLQMDHFDVARQRSRLAVPFGAMFAFVLLRFVVVKVNQMLHSFVIIRKSFRTMRAFVYFVGRFVDSQVFFQIHRASVGLFAYLTRD